MPRIGPEYRDPRIDYSRWSAQKLFLERVSELVPETLDSLRQDVLPAFRRAAEATRPSPRPPTHVGPFGDPSVRRASPIPWRTWAQITIDVYAKQPEMSALRDRLSTWSSHWNLTDDWALDSAIRTLRSMEAKSRRRASVDIDGELVLLPPWVVAGARIVPFTFERRGWIPQKQQWIAYQAETREEFEHQLKKYRDDWASWLEASGPWRPGLKRSPEKRTRGGDDAFRHSDWLVRFQVQGWTHERIAKEYDRAYDDAVRKTNTVADAIRETAKLIGLTRRSSL